MGAEVYGSTFAAKLKAVNIFLLDAQSMYILSPKPLSNPKH